MPANPTPEMLKKMRVDDDQSKVSIETKPKTGKATVEDAEDEETQEGFAPGADADYFAEEDDEGRFFGGGLTSEQKEILSIFEHASGEGVQEDVRANHQIWVFLTIY